MTDNKTSLYKGNRREKGEDFFQTPETSIRPILKFIPSNVKTIWEPTYGLGAMGRIFEDNGYSVVRSDLYPKVDNCPAWNFLTCDIPECDMIIFNPPFSYKTEFLKRACEIGKPFMFICPFTIVETSTRFDLMRLNHLSIINLRNRTNYCGKDGRKVWFHSVYVTNIFMDRLVYAD